MGFRSPWWCTAFLILVLPVACGDDEEDGGDGTSGGKGGTASGGSSGKGGSSGSSNESGGAPATGGSSGETSSGGTGETGSGGQAGSEESAGGASGGGGGESEGGGGGAPEEPMMNIATVGAGKVTQQFAAADPESVEKAFDKDHNSKWVTYHEEGWIQYFFATAPASVTSYGLVSGNDDPLRDPKDWVLLGNDTGPDGDDESDSEWTVLDTRSNQPSFAARNTLYEFNVTTPGSFKFYRLKIEAPVSGVSLQLSELELYDASDTNVVGGGVALQRDDTVLEGVHNLFDHRAFTKWTTQHSAAWVQYEPFFPSNPVEAYTIVSGNDGPDRDPRDWVLLGNDTGPDGNDASDSEWTVLDARTDQGPFAEREQAYTYTVENPGTFKFYRFKVTENNGATDFLQMSELELLTH